MTHLYYAVLQHVKQIMVVGYLSYIQKLCNSKYGFSQDIYILKKHFNICVDFLIFAEKNNFSQACTHAHTKKRECYIIDVSSTDRGTDRTVLLNWYRSLVRSTLDYGCIAYGSARPSYIKLLDTVHHQGLRLSLGAFRTSPVDSLYVEANEPSL